MIKFTKEELKANAIKAMENCMAYITAGRERLAHINYGSAITWEDAYNESNDIFLEDECKHFMEMKDKYYEKFVESPFPASSSRFENAIEAVLKSNAAKWNASLLLVHDFLVDNIQYGDDWDNECENIAEMMEFLSFYEKD